MSEEPVQFVPQPAPAELDSDRMRTVAENLGISEASFQDYLMKFADLKRRIHNPVRRGNGAFIKIPNSVTVTQHGVFPPEGGHLHVPGCDYEDEP